MNRFKNYLIITLYVLGTSVAFGQNSDSGYKRYPHMFVGIQGGAQTTWTNYDQTKLITPTASVYFGGWFTPVAGMRLHVNGLWNKGGYDDGKVADFTYKYKYITTNLDLMLNLVTMFGKKDYYPLNVHLIGGVGLNTTWDNDEAYAYAATDVMPMAWSGTRLSVNARLGLMFDWNVAKHWNINLEVAANSFNDRCNSKIDDKNDWSMTAQLGLAYKFGFKKIHPTKEIASIDTPNHTLYDEMQSTVNDRMKNWAKRLSGESEADFLARTSSEAMQAQRLEFTKQVSTELAGNKANKTKRIFKYNTKSQELGVDFSDMPSITLNVPKSDIMDIKGVNDLKFTNTVYGLNPDDKFEVLYTDALNPNGKKYTYVKTRNAQSVLTDNYMPLSSVQEDIVNSQHLQAVATNTIQEAKDKNILSDNTTITVKTEMIPTSNGKADYKVTYNYTVKDNFSVKDDFAPGKYEAEKSAASTAMLKIIKQSINEDFSKYIKPGSAVGIHFKGSADASPIHGKIAYNNQYGEITNQTVQVNGEEENLTVTQETGITNNEQLSLVRAFSVKNYILKNVDSLRNTMVRDSYEVEVSSDEGSQYRRVAVEFLFHDAF